MSNEVSTMMRQMSEGPRTNSKAVPLIPLWRSGSLCLQVSRAERRAAGSAPHDPPRRRKREEHRPRGGTPTVKHGACSGRSSPRQSSVPPWVLNPHSLHEREVTQGSENTGPGDQDQLQCRISDHKLQGDIRRVAGLVPTQRNSQYFLNAQIREDVLYHLQ